MLCCITPPFPPPHRNSDHSVGRAQGVNDECALLGYSEGTWGFDLLFQRVQLLPTTHHRTNHLLGRSKYVLEIQFEIIYPLGYLNSSILLSHSYYLLSTRWMYRYTRIQILLRSTHLYSDPKSLQHFSNSQTKQVQSNHLLIRPLTNDLELSWMFLGLFLGEGDVEHGREFGVVDFDILLAIFLNSLRFCQAYGPNFGMSKYDSWDILI